MPRFWTRHRRRKAAFLARVAASVAMFAGLVAIAFGLPNGPWEYSTIGVALKGRWRGSVNRGNWNMVIVIPRGGGFITADPQEFHDPSNPLQLTKADLSNAIQGRVGHYETRTGLWAVATRHETLGIGFMAVDYSGRVPAPPGARDAVLEWLRSTGGAAAAARLASGDINRRVPIWRGYALNAASLALLVSSILTMPRRGWSVLRSRPPAGSCNDCGYDLRGLPTPTCPECGSDQTPQRQGRSD